MFLYSDKLAPFISAFYNSVSSIIPNELFSSCLYSQNITLFSATHDKVI